MPYIKHLSIATGRVVHSERSDVPDGRFAALARWLAGAVESSAIEVLPPPFSPYGARCRVQDGALMVTVHTPRTESGGPSLPLVTFGVAQDAGQGAALWAVLLQGTSHAAGLYPPAAPWCATHLHPAHVHVDDAAWLDDLERGVAWAWMARGLPPASAVPDS